MATRSAISLVRQSGVVKTIYCHWDGYPSGVGAKLLEKCKTTRSVKKLLNDGDRTTFNMSYMQWKKINPDRNDTWEYCKPKYFPSIKDSIKAMKPARCEFYYFWLADKKMWVYCEDSDSPESPVLYAIEEGIKKENLLRE